VGDYATAQQVWVGVMIFARLGAIMMLLPGFGEQAVPPRVRLSLALLIALMMYPLVSPMLGTIPETMSGLFGGMIREVLIGLMIGGILRLFFSSLAVAGEIVSLQTTLSFSQTASPMEAQPSTSLSTFLTVMGITLIFATNLHHLFITAIFGSYDLFAPGKNLPLADAGTLAIQTVGKSFALGLQLAAPVVVFAIVFNIATGLVGRLMPQFQIFFVASPLAVIFGLSIFAISLGMLAIVWIGQYRDLAMNFAGGR
jgi:flagellar biosynthesis protein FliR